MPFPFWNYSSQAYSDHLWCPPLSPPLPISSGSWFSISTLSNSQTTGFAFTDTHPIDPHSTNSFKCRKIRLYPNAHQRQILRSWFGTARWTYNRALDLVHLNSDLKFDRTQLLRQCVNRDVFQNTELAWVLGTPASIRQAAAFDLLDAYKSALAQYRFQLQQHGEAHPFEMSYRSKKDPSQSIGINHRDIRVVGKSCRFFPTYLTGTIATKQTIPRITHDCNLQWLPKLNHFYLCIPLDIEMQSEIQTLPIVDSIVYRRTVSIDPGVITFATLYDSWGYCSKWGHHDISRIYRLCHHYDKLQSQWSHADVRHQKRYRLKRAGARLQLKIRNLVDDLHKKLAKFLCENYQRIIIPKFETQGMIRRGQRRLNSVTARKMITWAHYRFQQRLIAKAREYPNCQVLVVDEAYTSKTCGRCGRINQNLGGKRIFKCPHCGLEIDRDVNGARNILIKTISK
jgi:putative transposase